MNSTLAAGAAARTDAGGAPHLLRDVRPDQIAVDPYVHLLRRDAVPAGTYAALEAEFPGIETILDGRIAVESNQAVRMTVKQVLGDKRISPLWREFFEYHTSADYWRDVVRLFGAHFRNAFPDLEERVGRLYEDWRVAPRGYAGDAELHLDCQFVMNTAVTEVSSVKTAHVDLCDKIFSALFYFREQGDATPGGDFELYRWRRSPRFIKHRALDRDVAKVKTVHYAPNTYTCFVNSAQAVHGVSPRGITATPRRYINFIAELPIKAFRPVQLNKWQKLWYRQEVQAAAQDERY